MPVLVPASSQYGACGPQICTRRHHSSPVAIAATSTSCKGAQARGRKSIVDGSELT
jgi:hypothetical protein